MLVRVACVRCQLASLWTDEPRCFLATVCRDPRHCEATLHDEAFVPTAECGRAQPPEEPLAVS
jgi:hypothetical protein